MNFMTVSDLVLILAVLIAPFLAVFAQKQIESWRSRRDVKLWIFKTLMATRGAVLSPQHVQALNMIDLEFSNKKKNEKEVKVIWKEYLDHLASLPQDPAKQKAALPTWSDKSNEFLATLLHKMGKCFGYDFDKVYLKKGIYLPQGHAQVELELRALRFYALQILSGEKKLSTLTYLVSNEVDAFESGQELQNTTPDSANGDN